MWFGVYQRSTAVLRYASAGHPPALVLTAEDDTFIAIPLAGGSMPVGMFDDTVFTVESYHVPADARILLYSDGVLGDPPQTAEFVALCTELAAAPSYSLKELAARVPITADAQGDDDDCSLVQLTFSR
jgi:sigma-B regulation protein RsbU (phosphoserine phosphatase)